MIIFKTLNLKITLKNIFKKIPKKFILVGIVNTFFGYFISVINLHYFINKFSLITIGVLNNFLAITFAFILLKFFVFPTKNTNWLYEYLRSFIVYGFKAIVGIFILWISINLLNLNIFLSQGFAMIFTAFLTYAGHKKFTFKV